MSHQDDTYFTPAEVDQQIERYLSGSNDTPEEHTASRALQHLQRVYQIRKDRHAPSLERVWQRVLASETQESVDTQPDFEMVTPKTEGESEETQLAGAILPTNANGQRRRRARPLFAQLAAVLCIILIVGSFVLVSNLSHRQQPASLPGQSGSGFYAYLAHTIYRLDSRTHQILWKHAFASNETVLDGTMSQNGGEKPFVEHGILYVETQITGQGNARQYLSALRTTNGALLWRLPSARALINNTAVYTLVESRTSNLSTLTARDLQTGKQLWQRQYPIVGARSDPGHGTDTTEGFRLITLTDQVLYAVASYPQNGQVIFTRYGLSPKDGSILWQNSDVIVGRMPIAEAQIVDGVVYTTEYNLKSVTPYVDTHGMTVTEIPQSRAAAYSAVTGKRLWQTPEMVGEEPNGDFYMNVSDDMLYYQTYNQDWPATARQPNSTTTLRALSTRDGSQRWQYQDKDGSMTGSVLAGNGLYLETSQVSTVGGKQNLQIHIVALDARTGGVRWSTPVKLLDGTEKTPTPVPNSPEPDFTGGYAVDMAPVASADTVYYSTPGSRVYALRASDGTILTQFWVDKTDQTTVLDRAVLFVVP